MALERRSGQKVKQKIEDVVVDFNKACPKDSFSLLCIDLIVDSIAGHTMLSFMEAYYEYNQIQLSQSDQEKIAFITDRGLHYYQVMPFDLKNAKVTYQGLVNLMSK